MGGVLSRDVEIREGYLRFNSIRKSDEGDYRCMAENDVGQKDELLRVFVKQPDRPQPPTRPPTHHIQVVPDRYHGAPGDNVVLTCGTDRFANVEWTKDADRSLPGHVNVDRHILRIINAKESDSGTYICTIISQGRPDSYYSEVTITSQDIYPEVKRLPESQVIIQGSDFNIVCEASGNPYPTIEWIMHHDSFKQNVKQSGNTLHIYNAQMHNRGIYACVSKNRAGEDESSIRIDIDPREPPILDVYPTHPQKIRVGESAQLSCRATGQPQPTVVWVRKDGRPISYRFKEEYEGTLTLNEATMDDAGEYECKGENIAGIVTLTTWIEVQEPPVITILPSGPSKKVTEGDELKITCSGVGLPNPMTHWTSASSESQLSRGISSTAVLHRQSIRLEDAGYYTCTSTNEAGSTSEYIEIIVEPLRGDIPHSGNRPDNRPSRPDNRPSRPDNRPDRPDNRPHRPDNRPQRPHEPEIKSFTAYNGSSAILSCNPDGDPDQIENVRTSWRRSDRRPLPYNVIESDGRLVIEMTTDEVAGRYECIVEDGEQPPYAHSIIELTVVYPPQITFHPPMPMTVLSGDDVQIVCEVSGEQPIHVYWHGVNDTALPRTVRTQGDRIMFRQIRPSDEGKYYCSATNERGKVTKVAEVIVSSE